MRNSSNNRFNLPNHISVMNMTAAVAIGALSMAAFLIATESAELEDQLNAAIEANLLITSGGDLAYEEQELINDNSTAELINTLEPNTKIDNSNEIFQEDGIIVDIDASSNTEKMIDDIESFDASCYDGNLLFSWTTVGKTNNQYEIEKSYDNENFEVFTVAPQPQKSDGKNIYMVEEYVSSNEVAYYRLRKKVGKKKYEYSGEIEIKCSKEMPGVAEIDVFPNGYGSFRILIDTKVEDSFSVSLYDINDIELAAENFNTKAGSNEFVLNSASISRGEYSLKVTNGTITKEKKVVLK